MRRRMFLGVTCSLALILSLMTNVAGITTLAVETVRPQVAMLSGSTAIPLVDAAAAGAVIDVKASFGATGDGVSDDTFAIQSSIDAAIAQHSVVFLPPGTYLTDGLTITQPITLVGASPVLTTLKARPGVNAVITLGDGTALQGGMEGLQISNLGIDGSNVANYGIWMRQYGGIRARFERLLIQKCKGNPGIGIANEDNAFSMLMTDVTVKYNQIGIRLVKRVQESKIIGSQIYGNSQHQIVVGDGSQQVGKVSIIATQVEPTSTGATGAALVANGAANLYLASFYSEAKTGATEPAIEVVPGLTSTIVAEGMHLNGNNVGGYAIRLPGDNTSITMTLISPIIGGYLQSQPVENLNGANKQITWIGARSQPATLSVRGGLIVGENGGRLWGNYVGAVSYDPPHLEPGAWISTTVHVPGALSGDMALAGFTSVQDGIYFSATVTGTDTVSVLFENKSGGAIDLPEGTLEVSAWNYR